jgi:4-amino-4-deoxy-L-arabinose transferase-like glycosyltransferase
MGVIVAVAAALRILGIGWGLPDSTHLFSYQPDEFFSLQAALGLLRGDPNPHFFNYPSLYLYLAAAACMIAHGAAAETLAPEALLRAFTLDARIVTVLLALVTLIAAYGAAMRLGGRRAGLLAALLVAVAPGHVLYSHFAAVDVPLACFMTLAAWAGILLLDDQRWKTVLPAGLACGAAAATKYNGALVLVVPLLYLALWAWRAPKPRPWRAALLRAGAIVLIAGLAFAVLSPYVFLDWPRASQDIAFETRHMREGDPTKAADPCGWHFQARALAYAVGGPIPLTALLALFAVGCRATWPRSLPIVLLALAWYLMIGATSVRYARYALPLVPLLAVVAASPLSMASRLKPLVRATAALCALGMLVASTALSGSLAFRPEPRDTALQHTKEAVPRGERIGVARTIWFDMPPLDFVNGGDALGRMFAELRRPVRPLAVIPNFDAQALREERPPWFVESDFQTADWLRSGDRKAAAFRQALEAQYTLERAYSRTGWIATSRWGPVPHDFSYPFTTVRVWHLKGPEVGAETAGKGSVEADTSTH